MTLPKSGCCGGNIVKVNERYHGYSVEALRCQKCGKNCVESQPEPPKSTRNRDEIPRNRDEILGAFSTRLYWAMKRGEIKHNSEFKRHIRDAFKSFSGDSL